MNKTPKDRIPGSEITPPEVYVRRRELLAGLAGALVPAALRADPAGPALQYRREPRWSTDERPNSWEEITTYNNYYEFGTGKQDPSERT